MRSPESCLEERLDPLIHRIIAVYYFDRPSQSLRPGEFLAAWRFEQHKETPAMYSGEQSSRGTRRHWSLLIGSLAISSRDIEKYKNIKYASSAQRGGRILFSALIFFA